MSKSYGLLLKLLLPLFPLNYCAAATIYVNINSPTPGAGTSWVTPYTDLNIALSAAASGDQVWVAQGTYKPLRSPAGLRGRKLSVGPCQRSLQPFCQQSPGHPAESDEVFRHRHR
jgi:hypothetical protein